MADYFVQFSCIFDVGSAENVLYAHGIVGDLPAHLDLDDYDDLGFQMEADLPTAERERCGFTPAHTESRNTSSPLSTTGVADTGADA